MSWRGLEAARKFSVPQFKTYFMNLVYPTWKPSGMTLHNTGSPSLKRWQDYPGETWMKNLKSYYISQGWDACPHAFVDGKFIYAPVDFNVKGTHSCGYNGTRLGIEMIGDFSIEDDDSGSGLLVKQMTVALFAICHSKMGWDPYDIKLHKEDPLTTHDCPGKNIDKGDFIRNVIEYMGAGGEHIGTWGDIIKQPLEAPRLKSGTVNVPKGKTLNLRNESSAGSMVMTTLPPGQLVTITAEAMNGATKWFKLISVDKTVGWAAARFITVK